MKKNLYLLITLLICVCNYESKAIMNFSSSGCSVAGTASLQTDSICYEDSTVLNLTGYIGSIQWQSFDGTNWINETGTGATTDNYQVIPGATKSYRALVTNGVCTPDSSNIITITVGIIPVPTGIGATRCGPGMVTVTGSGNGILQWYSDSISDCPIGSGSPFNTYIPATTTLYLADNTSLVGCGKSSPILVTEADLDDFNGGDDIEIMNVAHYPVDVTGWKVAVSNDYANINSVNPIVQTLSGVMAAGDIMSWNDVSAAPLYWGTNILWTSGPNFGGWVAIIDNNNVLVEFVVWDYPASAIQSASLVINGITYTIGSQWIGNPLNNVIPSGSSVSRQGNLDHNDATDWGAALYSINALNPGMTIPFLGLGCSSPRVPIDVTVTFADPITITAHPVALCAGDSSILIASSANPNYTYTWSPNTALSSTTGDTVTASPGAPVTYIVIGDEGSCSNRDTVFIDVGPQSQSGVAASSLDTICAGKSTVLTLSGSVGHVQWQSNTGTGWVNETGTGNDSTVYEAFPSSGIQYQAIVTSGGCEPDSSSILTVGVLNVNTPIVNDTIACANDTISITATGSQSIAWFNMSSGGNTLFTGNPFSTYIIGDTTFYAAEKAGVTEHVGPVSNAIGSSNQSSNASYGLQFDVTRPCTLDKIYFYPYQSGKLILYLVDNTGTLLGDSIKVTVTASASKTAVTIGKELIPGMGYQLRLGAGSVLLKYNFNGGSIAYPYTNSNSPLSITGFLNPFFNTSQQYYYFYDWEVFEGCYSALVPLNITTTPQQPAIIQTGTTLTSSASTGNQWYLNGNMIAGATSQTLTISQNGLYEVHVTVNGCTAITSINVTTIGINELQNAGISIYPNPVTRNLNINFNRLKNKVEVRLSQASGATVFENKQLNNVSNIDVDMMKYEPGMYLLEIKINDEVYRKTVVKN